MKIFRDFTSLRTITSRKVLAIGNFDGIHHGHHKVITTAKELSKIHNFPLVIMTFHPHPTLFFRCEDIKYSKMIYNLRNKILKLTEYCPDYLLLQRFNKDLCNTEASQFVKEALVENIRADIVVVGYDFMFGKDRKGDVGLLKSMATYYGFELVVIPKVTLNDNLCSSSNVRRMLYTGNILEANKMLTKTYSVYGRVVRGKQLASKLGFPTANLNICNIAIAHGVYTGRVTIDSTTYKAVINYGLRPTLEGGATKELMEIHIISGEKFNLYDKIIKVELYEFIRPEKKFNNIEELKQQIQEDINYAKNKAYI